MTGASGGLRLSRRAALLGAVGFAIPVPARAVTILFDARWREAGWLAFGSDAWRREGDRLSVGTDGAEGPVWRLLPETLWDAQHASWRWGVALSREGVGDAVEAAARTLALRFVFSSRDAAGRLSHGSPRRVARDEAVTTLIYVWGGAGRPGAIALDPGRRVAVVTRRQGGIGSAAEVADLAADHSRAFGAPPNALVAIAITADAAGAGGPIEAAIADLVLN